MLAACFSNDYHTSYAVHVSCWSGGRCIPGCIGNELQGRARIWVARGQHETQGYRSALYAHVREVDAAG